MEKNNKRKLTPYWKSIIILSGVIIICNILARIRAVCDFYVDNIFFVWSNTYGRITGIFPFSVGGVLIMAAVLIVIAALVLGILLIFLHRKTGFKRRVVCFYKVNLIIALVTGLIMTLNCSALYRCSKISDRCREYSTSELKEVCAYVVNKCNELSKQIERNEKGEAVYNGDIDKAISLAVKKMAGTNKRYRGYTPDAKPFLFSYIAYKQELIGEYYPFTMEANYSVYMNDLAYAYTVCHELSHLKGYIYEDEANYMSFITCIESDDLFLQYAGYISVAAYIWNDYMNVADDKNMDNFDEIILENDFEVYKKNVEELVVKDRTFESMDWVAKVEDTITGSSMNYYKAEYNYDEVTKLVLMYYDSLGMFD